MFDKPNPALPGSGGAPAKKEPEDMFDVADGTAPAQAAPAPAPAPAAPEPQAPPAPAPQAAPAPAQMPPQAPPVAPAPVAPAPAPPVSAAPPAAPELPPEGQAYSEPPQKKGGLLFKIVIALLIVIILALAGAVAYSYFFSQEPSFAELEDLDFTDEDPFMEEEPAFVPEVAPEPVAPEPEPEDFILPEERDSDSDGLTDDEEKILGTNPQNHDSDGDDLFDFDEAYVYETDPLDPDTDGDTFLDGEEVANGYDPKGPGKLFEVPTDE